MARRERVTRLKSHNRRRNKNPKLSPFQRQQKRAKLANQAPTLHSLQNEWKSIPRSQRLVSEYLMKRQANRKARRLQKQSQQQQHQQQFKVMQSQQEQKQSKSNAQDVHRQKVKVNKNVSDGNDDNNSGVMKTHLQNSNNVAKRKSKSFKAKCTIVAESLNKQMLDSVAPVANYDNTILDPTQAMIARKKQKKHKKKQQARRQKVKSNLAQMENELSSLVQKQGQRKNKRDRHSDEINDTSRKKSKQQTISEKKRRRVDEVFERIHNTMSKQSTSTTQTPAQIRHTDTPLHEHEHDHVNATSNKPSQNNHTSTASKSPAKAKDFYELVDVVRYGQRVQAPPVFDLVPNQHSAVSTLARKLQTQKSALTLTNKKNVTTFQNNKNNSSNTTLSRFEMLSSVGNSGIGNAKRLARLGLASANVMSSNMPQTDSNSKSGKSSLSASSLSSNKSASNAKEMQLLRERVLAAYERNKRSVLAQRKGVDMKHVFPRFS